MKLTTRLHLGSRWRMTTENLNLHRLDTESFTFSYRWQRRAFWEWSDIQESILQNLFSQPVSTGIWTLLCEQHPYEVTRNWINKKAVMYVGTLTSGNVCQKEWMSCYIEMERKCGNRRMAGKIRRKTKCQSIRNSKPIHIYINMYLYTHTCTSTPTNTSVKLHILSFKGSTRQPNVEKYQIFKLLTFWDSRLLGCDAASLGSCFPTFLWNFQNQSPSWRGITPQLHHCTNLKILLYFISISQLNISGSGNEQHSVMLYCGSF
jgi:hypothetical protein